MAIENDLKQAYKTLYDKKDPQTALTLYDKVLSQSSQNITALIYKAASLEKLYFGFADWHSDETLHNALDLLNKALNVAQERGDRSKIALVHFRIFIYFFNLKEFQRAKENLQLCKDLGYNDPTLPMWETKLETKLKKMAKKGTTTTTSNTTKIEPTKTTNIPSPKPADIPQPLAAETTQPKFRSDWYQSSNKVTLSLFIGNLPTTKSDINAKISAIDKRTLNVSYQIPNSHSEFQYEMKLSHQVDPENVTLHVFSKKLELTFTKLENLQWKTLEYKSDQMETTAKSFVKSTNNETSTDSTLNYPSSSKKQIDWSKLDVDEEEEDDDQKGSADEFFQKLYAGADPDTRRAMMKSFIESNGTTLNTNWEDVSKGKVEPAPPEGSELKHW
ncbi:hypothetical protein NCAS_0C05470 [Naumovozyma castellii]|uniref:SGS domain-containing protein n=1 Tax=Naumovozyma castellii TaxID=27288 RepID=G0VDH5_NAUCA|nr:hypothetical protein NCAS_0C05470 [Naumovozyma castellii CBS 4309]CCC69537.1 hypothetical protein NCAS_0C05470 [Naumovozyma castellii CBS 4309]